MKDRKDFLQNILSEMFKEFNKISEVNYYVDHLNKQVICAEKGTSGRICSLEEIKEVTFSNNAREIFIEANESWRLKKTGPEF